MTTIRASFASAAPAPPAPEGDGPLLVCVHGWLLSGRLWDPLMTELAPRWSVWAPDLPGFGRERRPRELPTTLASYGGWLAERCRTSGHRSFVLVGHSLGGSIALHAAGQLGDQLRGLVQISAGGGVYQPRTFARVRFGGNTFLQLRPGWLSALPGVEAMRGPLIADRRAARGLLCCSTSRGAVRQLPVLTAGLRVPSLWIGGSRDQVMEPRYVRHLAGYAPGHELAVLQGCGHLPMRQAPRQLAALIDGWLTGVLEGPKREDLETDPAQSLASPRS